MRFQEVCLEQPIELILMLNLRFECRGGFSRVLLCLSKLKPSRVAFLFLLFKLSMGLPWRLSDRRLTDSVES